MHHLHHHRHRRQNEHRPTNGVRYVGLLPARHQSGRSQQRVLQVAEVRQSLCVSGVVLFGHLDRQDSTHRSSHSQAEGSQQAQGLTMLITNVIFTGSEIRKVIEKSGLGREAKSRIWASFLDYATIEKQLDIKGVESIDGCDTGDEHPTLFD